MEEDTHTPIIFERPFLATVECNIMNDKLPFDAGDNQGEFNCLRLLNSLPFLMSAVELM